MTTIKTIVCSLLTALWVFLFVAELLDANTTNVRELVSLLEPALAATFCGAGLGLVGGFLVGEALLRYDGPMSRGRRAS